MGEWVKQILWGSFLAVLGGALVAPVYMGILGDKYYPKMIFLGTISFVLGLAMLVTPPGWLMKKSERTGKMTVTFLGGVVVIVALALGGVQLYGIENGWFFK
jgi:hypothetical protein